MLQLFVQGFVGRNLMKFNLFMLIGILAFQPCMYAQEPIQNTISQQSTIPQKKNFWTKTKQNIAIGFGLLSTAVVVVLGYQLQQNRKRELERNLISSTKRGDFAAVENLINQHANVNAPDDSPDRLTALHYAAQYGEKNIAELLIQHHADIDALDIHGMTPLFRALDQNKIDMMKLLIKHAADPNIGTGVGVHNPPLIHAIVEDKVDAVRALLDSPNIDVNITFGNSSALSWAKHRPAVPGWVGNPKIIKLLENAGADDFDLLPINFKGVKSQAP